MAAKIALITGANRGIGLETARQLAKQGVHVLLGSRSTAAGKAALDQLLAEGLNAELVELDVNSSASRDALAADLTSRFGQLDILVNNAGVAVEAFPATGPNHTATAMPMELLRSIFETNFFAVVALTQKLLPLLLKSSSGRIVNLASILGSLSLHAKPGSGVYDAKSFAYDASKTAVNALTIHLAYELRATNIKVNSAHPGWVKTDMGGPAALMGVEEGAHTSVELALLPDDGPTGGFFHRGKPLPW